MAQRSTTMIVPAMMMPILAPVLRREDDEVESWVFERMDVLVGDEDRELVVVLVVKLDEAVVVASAAVDVEMATKFQPLTGTPWICTALSNAMDVVI